MHHFPIAFALAQKSLGSRISGGAFATTARALHMMGHVTVKFRWTTGTTPIKSHVQYVLLRTHNINSVDANNNINLTICPAPHSPVLCRVQTNRDSKVFICISRVQRYRDSTVFSCIELRGTYIARYSVAQSSEGQIQHGIHNSVVQKSLEFKGTETSPYIIEYIIQLKGGVEAAPYRVIYS